MSGTENVGQFPELLVWIILVVCGVSVLLNISVIAVIAKLARLQTAVDIFLTNLAVSDILLAGLVHPLHFKNVFIHEGSFVGGNSTCKLMMFVPMLIIMATVLTMVAIAIDRYRVMIWRRTLSRQGAVLVVGIIWITAAAISAPQIYEYNVYSYESDSNETIVACGSEGIVEHFETIYASCLMAICYVSSLSLILCYSRISFIVWNHARRFEAAPTQQALDSGEQRNNESQLGKRISKRKLKVFKMLASSTTLFVFLWTPYFVLFTVQEIADMDHTNDFTRWPHIVSRAMTLISTVVNPALYLAFCDPLRKALLSLCGCRLNQPTGNELSKLPTSAAWSCEMNCRS